ncbi:putative P-loop ATPase [Acidovorax sp. CF316]|uniref:VapE domain-containing protein n=1 Tax=Acidovorax sp. CF316 TaxID=1144317 RepID=UPI00026BC7F9|nr:VapE domain-containing protein [Acidovorax sp. CF316]EJE49590.1 putative P-loop ATPase [Acidovorax sp. CF316]
MQSSDQPTPPAALAPVWKTIPAALADRQQWVLWKYEWDVKRSAWLKVPYYVAGGRRTGDQGSDRDRSRLATLPLARRAFEKAAGTASAWTGVGFGFLPDDGLIGIDLDKCRDLETGVLSERAAKIVQAFHSFTEFSPSGRGLHIYLLGKTQTAKSNDIGVEMFCEKQYFTVTGHHMEGTPLDVVQADDAAVRRMHVTIEEAKKKYNPPAPAPAAQRSTAVGERDGRDDFAYVNGEAMRALHVWVPALFGGREVKSGQGYRLTPKALGRDLQEDLSIKPEGIVDWGVADMGDARQGKRTPVDVVMEWGPGVGKPGEALRWLAQAMGITLDPPKKKNANKGAAAGGQEAADAPAPAGDAAAAEAGGGGDGKPPKKRRRGGDDSDGGDDDADGGLVELYNRLVMHRGRPMDCRENVMYALQLDPTLKGMAKFNDFTRLIERSRTTPWGHPPGEWNDEDDLMLGEYLLREHRLGVKAKGTLRDGVLMAARSSRFNPVVDLIEAEAWDDVPRLETWLSTVYRLGERKDPAEAERFLKYTRLIGRCFFMGLVNRAIRPGCKFDYMLIIKGEQGLAKSTLFRAIAGPFFTDNGTKVGEKDSLMAQQLAWIVESAELESLNKAESTSIKQYLSVQDDLYRPPYGAQMVKAPRHFVNVGTTNAETFLKDATGDRRFWPLEVFEVFLERLKEMLPQLLAEAMARLDRGEQYWPTREEEKALVFPEHEQFKHTDSWEDMLHEYVNAPTAKKMGVPAGATREFFATTELYEAMGIKADRIDANGNMDGRMGRAMKGLGFERHRESNGARRRGFKRLKLDQEAVAAAMEAAKADPPGIAPSPIDQGPPGAMRLPPGPFSHEGDDDGPIPF